MVTTIWYRVLGCIHSTETQLSRFVDAIISTTILSKIDRCVSLQYTTTNKIKNLSSDYTKTASVRSMLVRHIGQRTNCSTRALLPHPGHRQRCRHGNKTTLFVESWHMTQNCNSLFFDEAAFSLTSSNEYRSFVVNSNFRETGRYIE